MPKQRGRSTARKPGRTRQTHCRKGHEFRPDNVLTFTSRGRTVRTCRICRLAYRSARHKRKMQTDLTYRVKQQASRQRFNRSKREWLQEQEDAKLSAPASAHGFTEN